MGSWRRHLRWVVVASVVYPVAGCVTTFGAPTARFGRYRTVAFEVSREPPAGWGPSSVEAQDKVERAAAGGVEAHGYLLRMLGEPTDVVVTIHVGRRWRRVPGSVALTRAWTPREPDFNGAFVVDAFDRSTRDLVWHGEATTDVDLARIDHDALKSAMASVLSSFPARAAP
jgi:hypothetical protein